MHHGVDVAADHHVTRTPCSHARQMRQHDAADFVDQCIGILPAHQLALLFHQAQLQHFGLDRDVRGIGFRSRRASMLRAQVLDVFQPRCGLIVTAVAALLDHRFRRQPRHVLPCASQDASPDCSRSQCRRPPCGACRASVQHVRASSFRSSLILYRKLCRFAAVRSGIATANYARAITMKPCRRAGPAFVILVTVPWLRCEHQHVNQAPPSSCRCVVCVCRCNARDVQRRSASASTNHVAVVGHGPLEAPPGALIAASAGRPSGHSQFSSVCVFPWSSPSDFGEDDLQKALILLERVNGIEPSSSAWKAVALPLSYTREWQDQAHNALGSFCQNELNSRTICPTTLGVVRPYRTRARRPGGGATYARRSQQDRQKRACPRRAKAPSG